MSSAIASPLKCQRQVRPRGYILSALGYRYLGHMLDLSLTPCPLRLPLPPSSATVCRLRSACCTPLPRYGLAPQREASFSFQLQDLSVDTVTRYVLLASVHKNDALMDVSGEGKGSGPGACHCWCDVVLRTQRDGDQDRPPPPQLSIIACTVTLLRLPSPTSITRRHASASRAEATLSSCRCSACQAGRRGVMILLCYAVILCEAHTTASSVHAIL